MALEMLYQNCNVKEKLHILKQQWADLLQKPEHQKIRIKDAADILNVSEAELLSTTIGEKSDFLRVPNWLQLFKEIVSLGPMMYFGDSINRWAHLRIWNLQLRMTILK